MLLLISSYAAVSISYFEAESASISSELRVLNDTSASSGSYLSFGDGESGGPGGGTVLPGSVDV